MRFLSTSCTTLVTCNNRSRCDLIETQGFGVVQSKPLNFQKNEPHAHKNLIYPWTDRGARRAAKRHMANWATRRRDFDVIARGRSHLEGWGKAKPSEQSIGFSEGSEGRRSRRREGLLPTDVEAPVRISRPAPRPRPSPALPPVGRRARSGQQRRRMV